ncbi:MgtC/SapB family protein [Martelella sp. AD-3]|uniref:MgtC/SapB family protein n=1 Tax=Martelella sp. AD-3 TaxID=686597 RepID=UPI00046410FB|nr:MgtC/SapB family protein [Martelella sp. AD-3]AMM84304.1 preprotein translocase subunit TatA [Martelella sp. AD-3]
MEALIDDITTTGGSENLVFFVRLMGAALFGGLIGLEREMQNHAAGLRTHILVSLAAALFVIVSTEVPDLMPEDSDVLRIDPTRVIQSITEGVAFLAAGIVFFQKGTVKGLTTGAGLWLSGAIGLTIGLGLWTLGIFSSVLGIIVLLVLHRIEVHTRLSRRKTKDNRSDES